MRYEFKHVLDHIEVYVNGRFAFSADSLTEAEHEIKAHKKEESTL